MPINAVKKGSRNQLKTRKYLEEAGWIVYTVVRAKYMKNHDIFGLFDHIAYKNGKIRLIQTKSNRCAKKDKDAIRDFYLEDDIIIKEVFIWYDGNPHEPEIIRL